MRDCQNAVMSNYLAIATVTASLQRTLQAALQVDVDGARVTTVQPNSLGGGTPETGVNIYLYHAAPNPAWRNSDLRTRFADGKFAKRPQAALDLYYLISCYGNEVELEPQRLLGSVVRTLHARPVLTREAIYDTIADSTFAFLTNSNLAEQVETVKFMPVSLGVEELSNIWSVFFQTPHALSIAYQASTILIESDDIPQRALPVRDRSAFTGTPFRSAPVVDKVFSQEGILAPIVAHSTLIIRGSRLKHEQTRVKIGGIELTPSEITDSALCLPLASIPPASLRAGVQSLQVIHRLKEANNHRGVESNAIALVLRPSIVEIAIANLEGIEREPRSAQVTLHIDLTVSPQQRVTLLLNEASSSTPAAYLFDATSRSQETASLIFNLYDVKPGEYLVRVQIDGAESLLEVDLDPQSPTFERYIGPTLTIP